MRIVEQTETKLHLRQAPWTRWSLAIGVALFGVLSAADGHFESQLECSQNSCDLRYNPFAVERFPRQQLLGAEAEQHPQRRQLARLMLVLRDERVPFDLRYQDLRVIEAQADMVRKPEAFHLGGKPDTRKGTLSLVLALAAAIGIASGSRWVSLRIEGDSLTIAEGGVFTQTTRVVQIHEVNGVREQDGRITIGLPGGEMLPVSDVQLQSRREALIALLKTALRQRTT